MTFPSEKFSLKWNNFQKNIISSFCDLGNDNYFSDVTLVCEEDLQIEGHKIILAACSPFFSSLLKKSKHSHPMIYMRGLKAKDLVAIVDFIYHGEADVFQEDLDGFLALADELKLKGLASSESEDSQTITKVAINIPSSTTDNSLPHQEIKSKVFKYERKMAQGEFLGRSKDKTPTKSSIVPVIKTVVPFDTNPKDLKTLIESMFENIVGGEKAWKCKVCGKETKIKSDIARHIETHLEGLTYPCNICEAVKSSSNSLNAHMTRAHRN